VAQSGHRFDAEHVCYRGKADISDRLADVRFRPLADSARRERDLSAVALKQVSGAVGPSKTTLTPWRLNAALDPILEQVKGLMGMGLDQFQVWELFSDRGAHKGVQVIPILDLIEAIILAVPCSLDHVLVSPCMTYKGNQGIQCPVDAD
jgi:hypothetical protein